MSTVEEQRAAGEHFNQVWCAENMKVAQARATLLRLKRSGSLRPKQSRGGSITAARNALDIAIKEARVAKKKAYDEYRATLPQKGS